MRSSSRHLLRDFLRRSTVLLLVLAAASPAQAQIGSRLKKLGEDAVKDAAKGKLGGAKDSSAAAGGASDASGAAGGATSAKVDLTVTADRVTMVMAAMQPAAQKAKAVAAAKAEQGSYETKRDAAVACVQDATKGGAMPSNAGMTAAQKLSDRQSAMSERYSASLTGSDRRKTLYLEDSLQVLTHTLTATMFGVTGKCGARPYMPAAVIEVAAQTDPNNQGDDFNTLTVSDPALSAMTRYQFGMVRERIALYAMAQAGLIAAKAAGKEGVFTEEELAVLTARRDELVAMAPLFKGGTLTWSGTSDLRGW